MEWQLRQYRALQAQFRNAERLGDIAAITMMVPRLIAMAAALSWPDEWR